MAVFVSASDESSGATHLSDFECTGWIAPETDWYRFFTPAWQQRVLDGPPKIEYLHVTDMRSKSWREKHGVTRQDADDRLDEAASVIGTMGSLYPVRIQVNGRAFRKLFSPHKYIAASGARKTYEPDYYAFMMYAYAVLLRVKIKFPDADKVDFMVEQKSASTKHIAEFYETLPNALRHVGQPELIPLLGEFIPGSKERIPLQAADFLCWHSQRADAGTLGEKDAIRWHPMAIKPGFVFSAPRKLMKQLADAFDKYGARDDKSNRVREIRQNDEASRKGSTQRDKGKAGRRKKGRNGC